MDALTDLLDSLQRDGTVPPTWADRHAPNGNLSEAWDACTRPRALMELAERFAPREVLVRAGAACVRLALQDDARQSDPAMNALAVAEAWADGYGDEAAVEQALASLSERDDSLGMAIACVLQTVQKSSYAHSVVVVAPQIVNDPELWREIENGFCAAIRGHIPCPTLDAIVRARSS
jgi:hypothetical protein